ncbi:MAG: DUF3373 family protein [Thermodesulfovibrionales bacterium]|nr:DUF3373 family protein [Thermodesulfovibrionales bacterium]
MKKLFCVFLSLFVLIFLTTFPAYSSEKEDLLKKIEALTKELEKLKQQVQELQKKDAVVEERVATVEKIAKQAEETKSNFYWLEISGDYRGRLDYLSGKTHSALIFNPDFNPDIPPGPTNVPLIPYSGETVKNEALLTNRLGLNLKANATEDVYVKVRLLMYKVWGHSTEGPVVGFFADRAGVFDGTTGHVPKDNILRVDQVYATWSNIADLPVWFSVGRRPSTKGVPSNLRLNIEKTGTAGVPSLLVDYAFDGLTIGAAPEISGLPGAYVKFCYGKGFDSGFRTSTNSLKDTHMMGIDFVPYDTETLRFEFNVNRGMNIFASPETGGINVGDINWYGTTVIGKIEKLGLGDLNLFLSAAISDTEPNGKTIFGGAFPFDYGLMWDTVEGRKSRTGYAIYLGARYDLTSTGTKIGLEYNRGSKNWITFAPAADDIWTAKLGTRGNVYEAYIIQPLKLKPISKRGSAFFRVGYQYYDFDYTGSNNWIGAPHRISSLTQQSPIAQFFPPLRNAHNLYLTFDVTF